MRDVIVGHLNLGSMHVLQQNRAKGIRRSDLTVPSTMSSGCFDPQRQEDAVSTEPKTSDKKPGTPQARVGSEAGRKADEAKAVRTRRRKVPSRRTQIALRAADPTPANGAAS